MNKDFLRDFRIRNKEAQQLREQLNAMESRIYDPKGQRLSKTPRGGSGGHTMDDLIIVHVQLQDQYRAALAEIERQQLEIEAAMQGLQPAERMVIRYRYIDLLNWEDVCSRMHYSWAQTHRIHAAALKALSEPESLVKTE